MRLLCFRHIFKRKLIVCAHLYKYLNRRTQSHRETAKIGIITKFFLNSILMSFLNPFPFLRSPNAAVTRQMFNLNLKKKKKKKTKTKRQKIKQNRDRDIILAVVSKNVNG